MEYQEMVKSMAGSMVSIFKSGLLRKGVAGPIIIDRSMLKSMDSVSQFREDVLTQVSSSLPDVRVSLGAVSMRVDDHLFDCITVRFEK